MAEYSQENLAKMESRSGGVWRFPPAFDGAQRSPLPRFTVMTQREVQELRHFFAEFATKVAHALVPGGHVFVASNPLLSTITFAEFRSAGLEKRGEVIRLVQTLRGGDRPKGAEEEFNEVTVMPRSCWEPWGIFRKPLEATVADNLRRWGTGRLAKGLAAGPLSGCNPLFSRPRQRKNACAAPIA